MRVRAQDIGEPLARRMDALTPRRLAETDTRLPRRPTLGPEPDSPTQKPPPRLLRLEKRKGMGHSRTTSARTAAATSASSVTTIMARTRP